MPILNVTWILLSSNIDGCSYGGGVIVSVHTLTSGWACELRLVSTFLVGPEGRDPPKGLTRSLIVVQILQGTLCLS